MPGVGGSVDVAVITADQGFAWVNRKKLKIEGKEIDLDKKIFYPSRFPLCHSHETCSRENGE
jgi:hypothetical protein